MKTNVVLFFVFPNLVLKHDELVSGDLLSKQLDDLKTARCGERGEMRWSDYSLILINEKKPFILP